MPHILRFLIIAALTVGAGSAQSAPQITLDLDSGKVLSQRQAFDPWYPASLTKLMTAYSIFHAIQSGEITADKPVRISKNARKQPPSRMGYRPGSEITMESALKLLIVKSANDIAVAIAESMSGSVPRFADRMNRDAARLGMTRSKFVNPHGLHSSRQFTTAYDLALLVRAIHKQFPQYASLFSAPSVLAPSRTKNGKLIKRVYYSYNLLLERFRGGDGFKTGFVCASGYNFIGAATRSGRRIAAVVLGRNSQTSRAVDAAKLIAEGFQQPVSAGTSIAGLKPSGPVPTGPRNMRNTLCTEAARAKRYEPGAGQAVIKSPWLQERVINKSPLIVTFSNGATAKQKLARIPRPSFRPKIRPGIPEAATSASGTPPAPAAPAISGAAPAAPATSAAPPAPSVPVETVKVSASQVSTEQLSASASRVPLPTFRPTTQ